MTTLIKNADVRTIAAGINVSRATAALPAGVAGSIFTVSGGRILLIALVGEVTTVLGATVMTLSLGVTPTVGSAAASVLGTTSAAMANSPVGTHIIANPGGAVVTDVANQAGGTVLRSSWFLVPVGAVTVTPSATETGSVKWDLTYVPLDVGAQVVAA
jgi:hypothetical protein